ncbi:hypothetical protein [Amycolatopsis sp. cg13]|uniref:hypothetical protein n=1 Tax=Amycolatopsis sp. cg13 TaxID=3238807 RepID=UPI003524FA97
MIGQTELPVWKRLYDAAGFVYETNDNSGRTWRMWFADSDPPGGPHPGGWRVALISSLDETAFIPHTGTTRDFDVAADLVAGDDAAHDLGGKGPRRLDSERPPTEARVQLLDESMPTSLYLHLPGRLNARGVAVTLRLDTGVLTACAVEEMLPDRTAWWAIPCVATAAANQALQEVSELALPLLTAGPGAMHQVRSPAEHAHHRIREYLDSAFSEEDLVLGRYAGEWFEKDPGASGITAETRDDELAAWAPAYEKEVASGHGRPCFPQGLQIGMCRYVVLRGTHLWARTYRDLLREQAHKPCSSHTPSAPRIARRADGHR